jgi:hypothetical protein
MLEFKPTYYMTYVELECDRVTVRKWGGVFFPEIYK